MKNLIRVFVLTSVLVSTSGYGGDTVMGSGVTSCERWTTEKNGDPQFHVIQQSWVLGYLSATNTLMDEEILASHDSQGLLGWVDNYCKEHPLHSIYDAAVNLAIELTK